MCIGGSPDREGRAASLLIGGQNGDSEPVEAIPATAAQSRPVYRHNRQCGAATGTSIATRRYGQQVRLKGALVSAGKKAWVEGDQIIGETPDLPTVTMYV